MGNVLKCPSCPLAMNSCVFTFSEDLVLKYTEGKPPPPLSKEEQKLAEDVTGDAEWMTKLRCIDDSHSDLYGLTPEQFEQRVENLHRVFLENLIICPPGSLKHCYQSEESTIKCAELADDYDKCVDEEGRKYFQS